MIQVIFYQEQLQWLKKYFGGEMPDQDEKEAIDDELINLALSSTS